MMDGFILPMQDASDAIAMRMRCDGMGADE